MSKRLIPSYGCSQEDHVPNCGHFGYSGTYLGNHAPDCDHEQDCRYECTCNPAQREAKKFRPPALSPPKPDAHQRASEK